MDTLVPHPDNKSKLSTYLSLLPVKVSDETQQRRTAETGKKNREMREGWMDGGETREGGCQRFEAGARQDVTS